MSQSLSFVRLLVLWNFILRSTYASLAHSLHRNQPSLPLGLWRALTEHDREARSASAYRQVLWGLICPELTINSQSLVSKYPAHTLDVPIDHSGQDKHISANATFPLRYWFDATYYKPGGPVFCLEGGETSGEDRLSYLDHGILKILSEATNGLSVVLEHRYYGESFPFANLSTDSLRFLDTHQSVADNAYFTKHATFPGLDAKQAKSIKSAKWIHYGGSYAGAKVALLRKLYPDTVFGAIASSAVTAAVTNYWKYFEAIRLHGDQECVSAIISTAELVNAILDLNSEAEMQKLKALFGVPNVTHIQDVVSLLTYPLGAWQARNWDPDVGSTGFEDFCKDLLANPDADRLIFNNGLDAARSKASTQATSYLANYAKYIRENVVRLCKPEHGQTQDDCFGTFDKEAFQKDDLEQTWRSWTWQYCTEWGYLQSAPPAGVPSLLSGRIDLAYTHLICKLAFPKGKYTSVPAWPNTTVVNQYGAWDFAHSRVAFIDGSDDPWIYATPHSPDAKERSNTLDQPFEIIKGGVHHWDENGLPPQGGTLKDEPAEIRRIHQREIDFVKAWLSEA